MTASPAQRVVLGASTVSFWDAPLIVKGGEAQLRAFIEQAFSVAEVRTVEIDRRRGLGRIAHGARGDLPAFWRRLGRALRGEEAGPARPDPRVPLAADLLYLGLPGALRVARLGRTLSTFRLRAVGPDHVRLGHPILRRRPEVRFRLEDELTALPGVRSFRANIQTGDLTIHVTPGPQAVERLLRDLERAWPRLLHGAVPLPTGWGLPISGSLLALSAAATFALPELAPVAVAGVVAYGAPNLVTALRELRQGRIGVSALSATGLAFFLTTRTPLPSSLIATLGNLWPVLARRSLLRTQRELLAPYRRRSRWAWLVLPDGHEVEIPADRLVAGDEIVVRAGDTLPADGRISGGCVATATAGGSEGEPQDKETGDAIAAGELILDGAARVRIERTAAASVASVVETHLPRGPFRNLPDLDEARRIADRNARPALALALYRLAATRVLRPSQGVIRPDYLTAPLIGAQLSAQRVFMKALRRGVLVRNPGGLDRLAGVELFAFDDTAPLVQRPLEVAHLTTHGATGAEVIDYAATALNGSPIEAALRARGARDDATQAVGGLRRSAGHVVFRNGVGQVIEVISDASPTLRREALAGWRPAETSPAEGRRVLWILRDGEPIGRIDVRLGKARPNRAALDLLRASPGPTVKLLYLSSGDKAEAARFARALGTDFAIGGLSPEEKAHVIRGFGRRTAWIGDGSQPGSAFSMIASEVALSTAAPTAHDSAEILLLAGLEGIVDAREAARDHRISIASDYRVVYAANLIAAGGALTFGYGGLQSGLISNSGSALVYARHRLRFAALRREQERQIGRTYAAFGG